MNTTASWLECPICEYRFSVPPEFADKSGKCPKCERVFNAAECHLLEKDPVPGISELEVPEPMVLGTFQRETDSGSVSSPPIQSAGPSSNEIPIETDRTFVTANKVKTDPNRILLYVAGSCVVAIALLIGIPLIAQSIFSKPKDDGDSVAVNEASTEPQQPKKEKSSSVDKKRKRAPVKRTPVQRNRKPEAFTDAELAEIWKKIHPSIVLVTANRDGKNNPSYGVVISDDGKIAVNLKQIENADWIRVKFAAKSFGSEERWQKPLAVVSLLSKSEKLNVGIIKINQKTTPVENRVEPVAANDRGVIPVLNNRSSEDFLRMTTLRAPRPFSTFTAADQKNMKENGFDPPAETALHLHSARVNKAGFGMPVFDEKGLFVGAQIDYADSAKTSIALSLNELMAVANDSSAKPVALERPARNEKTTASAKATKAVVQRLGAADSFEESLNRMSQIKWKITDARSYALSQDLAVWLSKAKQEYKDADFSRKNEMDLQFEKYREGKEQNLFWESRENVAAVNQLAIDSLRNKEDGWYAFVKVLKPAGLATRVDEESALLVEIISTKEKVLLLPGEVEGPFLQGSQFIVFGHNQQKRRLKTESGICSVIHVIDVRMKDQ